MESATSEEPFSEKAYGFDLYYNDGPPTLVPSTWSKNYGIGLYGRIGLQCYNLQKGTNLKFKRLEKHSTKDTSFFSLYITLEATDPATGSVCSFQTQFGDAGRRLSLGARITWFALASRIKQIYNQPIDDVWDEDTPGINEFYKVPMPKWFSDEALEKYYVVPESELHDNDWLQLLMEVAFFSKADRCLDAYLPLELNSVVVETLEDYTTAPSEKLKADNAIFYISYKCCSDPSTPLAGDHRAVVRKTMDGKPGHMCLEIVAEYSVINGSFSIITLDLLPKNLPPRRPVEILEGPPGFPPLFPELSKQDLKMAMQYISHSDPTERMARIERVRQGIEDNKTEASVRLTRISGDLDKGKGHVFSYTEPSFSQLLQRQTDNALVVSGIPTTSRGGEQETSSSYSSALSAPTLISTGFQLGPSLEGRASGSLSQKKTMRRRPTSWKRKVTPKASVATEDQLLRDGGTLGIRYVSWIAFLRCAEGSPGGKKLLILIPMSVEDLFDHHTGIWNENLLRQTFTPTDVEIILKTRKSPNRPDKLIWAYTKDGKYTSKSGSQSYVASGGPLWLNNLLLKEVERDQADTAQTNQRMAGPSAFLSFVLVLIREQTLSLTAGRNIVCGMLDPWTSALLRTQWIRTSALSSLFRCCNATKDVRVEWRSGDKHLDVDHDWDESTVHQFYKGPLPKWYSDQALERDSKKYYVVPESELHDNDWLQLLMEVAFFYKADRCLDAYLPLELNKVVVETLEDYTTEALTLSGYPHLSTTLAGDHLAVVRKTMDGKPEHMSLEVSLTRKQEKE
ncbi:hypothetical protein IGI04_031555 [Brassica rapa subsp. trilocularis]|uniref:Calpain catalytic domain-containing protein n=1 Tax=Brassica rapa subsp. trilocularis TaxID=1813537 RepID=A0ABQ7LX95_BRACM|nr:hypothetical protein IGI04_031555 [Brassica rapa subsp. trilocularis]